MVFLEYFVKAARFLFITPCHFDFFMVEYIRKQTDERKVILEKKKAGIFTAISDVTRRISITVNMTIYTIYLIYLIYSISADIGIKWLNIALAVLTAIFMLVYLILRLSSTKKSKQIKQAKKYYKRFKLVARAVSSLTAVYALIVAIDSVSPFALIAALLGAVFIVLRLVTELITYLIGRALKKAKNRITGHRVKRSADDENTDTVEAPRELKHKQSKKSRRKPEPNFLDEIDEKITPESECLLSDFEEL